MADGRDSPSHSNLRDRVKYYEKVWSGQAADTVDAAIDVDEIERRIEQRKRHTESPKIEVKLKHTRDTESPTRSYDSQFPDYKLRHVEAAEEAKEYEVSSHQEVKFKFERVVKRTVTEHHVLSEERPESPLEWYSEYRHQTLQTAPRVEYVRSKSEYDSHIAQIRGRMMRFIDKNNRDLNYHDCNC